MTRGAASCSPPSLRVIPSLLDRCRIGDEVRRAHGGSVRSVLPVVLERLEQLTRTSRTGPCTDPPPRSLKHERFSSRQTRALQGAVDRRARSLHEALSLAGMRGGCRRVKRVRALSGTALAIRRWPRAPGITVSDLIHSCAVSDCDVSGTRVGSRTERPLVR